MPCLKIAAMVVAATLSGCIASQQVPLASSNGGPDILLRVENSHIFDMRIYLDGAVGRQNFLGTVPARRSTVLRLPRSLFDGSTDLRLVADPIGSTQQVTSDLLDLRGVRHVEWVLRSGGSSRLVTM
jgi:hypothetical protein